MTPNPISHLPHPDLTLLAVLDGNTHRLALPPLRPLDQDAAPAHLSPKIKPMQKCHCQRRPLPRFSPDYGEKRVPGAFGKEQTARFGTVFYSRQYPRS